MPKVQLNDLSSLANETSVIATINANNAAIEEGFNNTVSRDGTSPNTLEDDINMNTHRIYNVPLTPFSNADVATKYYVDYMVGLSSDTTPTNPGDAVIDGSLHVTGNTDIDLDLNVDGSTVIDGTISIGDSLSAENNTFLVSNDKIHFTPSGNAGLELGRTDNVASTPYIDFHSGTDGTNDFDSRILATGGTTSDGAGSLKVVAADFSPNTNDGTPLGTTTLNWSDLFLASGGVINFANSNATLTHSTGLITSSVPFSVGTSNAITAGTIELGAASDTTLSRASAGNVNIEGNIIYRAGGTDVPVTDGGTGISSATAYGTIVAGTSSTGAFQVASPGTAGHVLTSNGASAVPSYQSIPSAGPQLQTAQATTSGTAVTFTGIPSSASIITMIFNAVSISTANQLLVQIGDSGGLETTGYVSTSVGEPSIAFTDNTSGFAILMNLASRTAIGTMWIYKFDSTTWISSHCIYIGGGSASFGGGSKTLSGTLDRVSLTVTGGAFDSGSVTITYQ